jgi:hypothetical protein
MSNPYSSGEDGQEMTKDEISRMMAQVALAERNNPHKKRMKELQAIHDDHSHAVARVVTHRRCLTEDQRRKELTGGDVVPHSSPAKLKLQTAVKKVALAAKLAQMQTKLGSKGASMFDAVRGAQVKQELEVAAEQDDTAPANADHKSSLLQLQPLQGKIQGALPQLKRKKSALAGLYALNQQRRLVKAPKTFSLEAVHQYKENKKEAELRKKEAHKKVRRAEARNQLKQRWNKLRRTSLFEAEDEAAPSLQGTACFSSLPICTL